MITLNNCECMNYIFFLENDELPSSHECDVTRMTKEKCAKFIMENLNDFFTLMNPGRVTHMFSDMMYKRHGINREGIPEFFLHPKLRKSLTSSHISAFEWTIINSCSNKMY